jgi:hypothetical protein
MEKKGLYTYVNVLSDPVIKNAMFLGVFIRLIPWTLFFLSLKYTIPFAELVRSWNIFHVTLTLAFPIWMAAIYFFPNVRAIKNDFLRMLVYALFIYVIITPALVLLGAIILPNSVDFFKSYKLF